MVYKGKFHFDVRHIHKDGRIRWVAVAGQVEKDSDGVPNQLIRVSQDITERKLAEEEIKQRREQLTLVCTLALDLSVS